MSSFKLQTYGVTSFKLQTYGDTIPSKNIQCLESANDDNLKQCNYFQYKCFFPSQFPYFPISSLLLLVLLFLLSSFLFLFFLFLMRMLLRIQKAPLQEKQIPDEEFSQGSRSVGRSVGRSVVFFSFQHATIRSKLLTRLQGLSAF